MATSIKIDDDLKDRVQHLAGLRQRSAHWIMREALREWTYKRSLRMQGIAELRGVWQEALSDKTPGISADDVLNRLECKYQAIANATGAAK